jgi:hypothetical protein
VEIVSNLSLVFNLLLSEPVTHFFFSNCGLLFLFAWFFTQNHQKALSLKTFFVLLAGACASVATFGYFDVTGIKNQTFLGIVGIFYAGMQLIFAGFLTGLFSKKWLDAAANWLHSRNVFTSGVNVLTFVFFLSYFLLQLPRVVFAQNIVVHSLFLVIAVLVFGLVVGTLNRVFQLVFERQWDTAIFYDVLTVGCWGLLVHSSGIVFALFSPWVMHLCKGLLLALMGVFYWLNIRMEIAHAYVNYFLNMEPDEPLHKKINGVSFWNARILCKRIIALVALFFAVQLLAKSYLLFNKTSYRQLLFGWIRSL